MLRKRNENYGTIKFVDISSENYSPEENSGIDFATVYFVEFGEVIKKNFLSFMRAHQSKIWLGKLWFLLLKMSILSHVYNSLVSLVED
jgi:hypothetical protein